VQDDKKKKEFRDLSLVALLHHFREKECGLFEDKMFSLLALCNDSEGLSIDYGMSRSELAYRILNCRQSSICLCAAAIIAQASLHETSGSPTTVQTEVIIEFELVNVYAETLVGPDLERVTRFLYGDTQAAESPNYLGVRRTDSNYSRPHSCDVLNDQLADFWKMVLRYVSNTGFERRRLWDFVNPLEDNMRLGSHEFYAHWSGSSQLPEIRMTNRVQNTISFRISLSSLAQTISNGAKMCSLSVEGDRSAHKCPGIENVRVGLGCVRTLEGRMIDFV
jgi:hypothetical protein